MSTPAWKTPIQYNEDRFDDLSSPPSPEPSQPRMTGRADDFVSNDDEPVDYEQGPRDEEMGVDPDEFDSADQESLDYDQGPRDEEFGLDDEDEPPAD